MSSGSSESSSREAVNSKGPDNSCMSRGIALLSVHAEKPRSLPQEIGIGVQRMAGVSVERFHRGRGCRLGAAGDPGSG